MLQHGIMDNEPSAYAMRGSGSHGRTALPPGQPFKHHSKVTRIFEAELGASGILYERWLPDILKADPIVELQEIENGFLGTIMSDL